jgi:hypothetical protein
VESRNVPAHIDIVLQQHRELTAHYMVAECKRVNPALAAWCFVRTPGESQYVQVEKLSVTMMSGRPASAQPQVLWHSDLARVYNLGLPIRGTEKGDPCGEGRTELDKAMDQVWRGLSGFVHFLRDNAPSRMIPHGDVSTAIIVPVLFTTAKLWGSDVDISESDLRTGKLPPTDLKPLPWLWLKQAISPGVRHTFHLDMTRPKDPPSQVSIADILRDRYLRCTAVVTADGIGDFLGQTLWSGPFG